MMEDIVNRLNTIFRQVFEDTSIEVTREMTSGDLENWDSLSHVTMIVAVEEQFGVKFTLRELVAMKNVGDLIDCLARKTTILR
jgi:acyl carrier protein